MKRYKFLSLRGRDSNCARGNLTIFSLLLMVAFVVPVFAFAATSAGVTPGSFWYFFDTASEKVALFFTFNPENKAKKALEYADERLAEIGAIAEEKNPDAVKTAIADYESNVALATEKSKEVKDKTQAESLLTSIESSASKNQEVLSAVLIKVPEEAKAAIAQAIEASKKGQEEAAKQIIELKGEVEKLRQEVAELKQAKDADPSSEVEKLKKEVEALRMKDRQREKVVEELRRQPAVLAKPTASSSDQRVEKLISEGGVVAKSLENMLINATSTFDSMVFEWGTSKPANSKVFLSGDNSQTKIYDSESGLSTRHIVHAYNLKYNSKYLYEIESIAGAEVAKLYGTISTRSAKDGVRVVVSPSPCTTDMNNKRVCSIEVMYFELDIRANADEVTIDADDNGIFIGSSYIDRLPERNRLCKGGEVINAETQMRGERISCPTLLNSYDGKPFVKFIYYPTAPGVREVTATVNGASGVALTQ